MQSNRHVKSYGRTETHEADLEFAHELQAFTELFKKKSSRPTVKRMDVGKDDILWVAP